LNGGLTGSWSILYKCFPDVNGGLPYNVYSILSCNVQCGEDAIAAFFAENLNQLASGFCEDDLGSVLNLILSANSCNLEEQLSNKCD
jgi:hypothetical protein